MAAPRLHARVPVQTTPRKGRRRPEMESQFGTAVVMLRRVFRGRLGLDPAAIRDGRVVGRPLSALAAGGIVGVPLALAACSNSSDSPPEPRLSRSSGNYGAPSARVVSNGAAIPKGGGVFKVGQPYTMGGRWYVPREEPGYERTGLASWYGADFHGRKTANGEIYDMNALTAAHPTLPMPSYVYVTNLANGRTILVRVNDRGPYVADRLIDLSARAARLLGTSERGVAQVRVRFAGYAPIDGNDRHERQFLASQPWASSALMAAAEPREGPPNAPAPRGPALAEAPRAGMPPDRDPQDWSFSSYRAQAQGRRGLGGPVGGQGGQD